MIQKYYTKILHTHARTHTHKKKKPCQCQILSFAIVGVCLGIGGHIQYLWCDPLRLDNGYYLCPRDNKLG